MKKILYPLFSLFLLYQTLSLINLTLYKQTDPGYLSQFLLAFLLNLFLTGVFAFVGFAFPTHKLLPGSYYKIKYPNFLRSVYTALRVNQFRGFLLLFFWGSSKNRKRYFNGTRKGLENLIFQSKQSEFGHLMAFFFVSVASTNFLAQGLYFAFIFTSIINLIGNFYPVVLQRHHRMRVDRIRSRF